MWQQYVDYTFTFIKESEIENINLILSNFHLNISFTQQVEENASIAFLEVLVKRKVDGSFLTERGVQETLEIFLVQNLENQYIERTCEKGIIICSEISGPL